MGLVLLQSDPVLRPGGRKLRWIYHVPCEPAEFKILAYSSEEFFGRKKRNFSVKYICEWSSFRPFRLDDFDAKTRDFVRLSLPISEPANECVRCRLAG